MADERKPSHARNSEESVGEDSSGGFEIDSINDEKKSGDSENALLNEVEKLKNDNLYLRADFDNFRKNAIKERSDLVRFGHERLARELLEILDTFDLALKSKVTPENVDSFVKGVELTSSNLKSLLNRFGVQEFDPQGQNFDPTMHEALSTEPTSEVEPGKVCRVFKKAYKLHDRLLRPAQVVIASEPAQGSQDNTSSGHNGEEFE